MKLKYFFISMLVPALLGMEVMAAFAENDIEEHRSCSHCGMDRKAYGYSRMLVIHENGSRVGVCSLNCTVNEMKKHRVGAIKSILVADRNSHIMIEAKRAFWVAGGNKRGVMTKNPKWAFATEKDAHAFVHSNGGKIVSWDAALLAAKEEK